MLKDEAIQFYTQLVEDQVPWRRSADGDRQLSDTESSAKPISWSEMKTAFEASYLSADALARSVEQIVTLTQGPNESVTSYANRLRDSFNNLNRQVQKHVQPVEALQIGIVERGLRPEILELFFFFPSFFSHTFTFQLLNKPWSQVSSLLPPGSCLQFLSRIGFSSSTARRFFIECC